MSILHIMTNFIWWLHFRVWVITPCLYATLSWPVWLFRIQQDHFGFHIPRGFASVFVCFELPVGLEPTTTWLQIKSSTNWAKEANMYQFHTGLLGTIRVSRTRCTTQSAIMCYQLPGPHQIGYCYLGFEPTSLNVCLHQLSLHIWYNIIGKRDVPTTSSLLPIHTLTSQCGWRN